MSTTLAFPDYSIGDWGSNRLDDEGRYWWVTDSNIRDGLAPKIHVTERSAGHGAYRARSHMSARPVTIEGFCKGTDRISREDARDLLLSIFVDGGQQLLTFDNGVSVRTLVVELAGTPKIAVSRNHTSFRWQLPMIAADGRMLDSGVQLAGPITVGGASTDGLDWTGGGSAGLDWATGGGLDWGASGASGVFTLTNLGTFETYPIFTVVGPVTDPTFTDPASGKVIAYSGTVGSGQTLVIDTSPFNRTVKLNGTDRFSSMVSAQWFVIPPKSSLAIQFGGAGGGQGSATWQYAYA